MNWLLIPPSRSNNEFSNHLVKKNRKQTQHEQFMRNFHGVHSPCRCTSHTNFTFIPSDSGYANSCRDLIIVVSLFVLIGSHQRMYSMYIITNYFILNKTYNKLEGTKAIAKMIEAMKMSRVHRQCLRLINLIDIYILLLRSAVVSVVISCCRQM